MTSASAATARDDGLRVENDFADVLDASMAGDADDLWVAVEGEPSHASRVDSQLALYRLSRNGWQREARLQGDISQAAPMELVSRRNQPCLGYMTNGRTQIRCESQSEFPPVPDPAGRLKGKALADLSLRHGHLTVLVRFRPHSRRAHKTHGKRPVYRVYIHRRGSWHGLKGQISATDTLAGLVTGPTSKPELGVTALTRYGTKRFVLGPRGSGSWTRVGPAYGEAGLGPMITGPAKAGGRVTMPVVNADRSRWRFYAVYRHRGPWHRCCQGHSLNQTRGKAQGGLYRAAGRVWAAWQEDRFLADGTFAEQSFVSRIQGRQAPHPVRLWRGRSIGPGPMSVASAFGQPYVLFSRNNPRDPRHALTIRVRPVEGIP